MTQWQFKSYMFTVGSNHPAVRTIKQFLNSCPGVQCNLQLTNVFDEVTQEALAQYQQKNQLLTRDGSLTGETYTAIGDDMNAAQLQIAAAHDLTLENLLYGYGEISHSALSFGQNKKPKSKKRQLAEQVAEGPIPQSTYNYVEKHIDRFYDQCPHNSQDMPKELTTIVWAAGKDGADPDLPGWDLAAQVMSILRREAAPGEILQRPAGDAGPAQLTTWWKRNLPELIVGNTYGSWNGRSENQFDGSVWDNIATLRNIVLFGRKWNGSFEKTAYGYGPGNAQSPRQDYAKAVMNNYNNVYKPFFECMANKVIQAR